MADLPMLRGRPMIWGNRAERNGYCLVFVKGCFTEFLRTNPDINCCDGHDLEATIARTQNGTFSIREDAKGIVCDIQPVDTALARDLVELIRSGTKNEMSITFDAQPDDCFWRVDKDGTTICEVRKAVFGPEISIVTRGAVIGTSIEVVRNPLPVAAGKMSSTVKGTVTLHPDVARLRESIAEGEKWVREYRNTGMHRDEARRILAAAMQN